MSPLTSQRISILEFWYNRNFHINESCVIYPYYVTLSGCEFKVVECFTHIAHVGIHKVTIQDAQFGDYILSRYYAMWDKPRSESSVIVCSSLHANLAKDLC